MSNLESKQQLESADSQQSAKNSSQDIEILLARAAEGSLTKDEQKALVQLFQVEITAIQSTSFSGPTPHPDIFNQYPDWVQRHIIETVEKEQSHKHELESRGLQSAIDSGVRGQKFGLIVALAGLLTATVIAFVSPAAAAIIGTFDLLGLVAVFAYPRYLQDRQQKRQSKQPAAQEDEDS